MQFQRRRFTLLAGVWSQLVALLEPHVPTPFLRARNDCQLSSMEISRKDDVIDIFDSVERIVLPTMATTQSEYHMLATRPVVHQRVIVVVLQNADLTFFNYIQHTTTTTTIILPMIATTKHLLFRQGRSARHQTNRISSALASSWARSSINRLENSNLVAAASKSNCRQASATTTTVTNLLSATPSSSGQPGVPWKFVVGTVGASMVAAGLHSATGSQNDFYEYRFQTHKSPEDLATFYG